MTILSRRSFVRRAACGLAGEKIRYDPAKDKLDKSEKDHLLTQTYRDKWSLPVV